MMTEQEGKKLFARLMLRHPGDFSRCAHDLAALVGIVDSNTIHMMALRWPDDEEVLQYKADLVAEFGEEHFLPTRAEVAFKLWQMADSKTVGPDDKIKALKEYSNLMGFTEKVPQTQINIVNKVLKIRDHGNDDDWEARLERNQQKLIEHVGS